MAFGSIIDLGIAKKAMRLIEKELKRSEAKTRKAGNRALKKALRSGKAAASKQVRDELNLKKKYVDRYIYTGAIDTKKVTGSLNISGRKIPLSNFMTLAQIKSEYQKGKFRRGKSGKVLRRSEGVAVKVYKKRGKTVYPGTFIQYGRGSRKPLVFKRTGDSRYPIKVQYGPILNLAIKKAFPTFERAAQASFRKNLEHELNREFGYT